MEAGADAVVEAIGDAEVVLLGEPTHGSTETYRLRREVTERLVREHEFGAVAIEGDWADAERVDRWLRGEGAAADAEAALGGFEAFPRWMWRNVEIRSLITSLRELNLARPERERAGFYGLDLYDVPASAAGVVEQLGLTDRAAAERARARYACFEPYGEMLEYGSAAAGSEASSCADEAAAQLQELQRARAAPEGASVEEELHALSLIGHARTVFDGERYFRTLYAHGGLTWDLRDLHMALTLSEVRAHLRRLGRPDRVVVWAHDSHVGDVRAMDMGRDVTHTLGGLTRDLYGEEMVSVGFTTYTGTVTAATSWGEDPLLQQVRPGEDDSYEGLLHRVTARVGPDFLLDLRDPVVERALPPSARQRMIGVLYLPATESVSHYVTTRLPDAFDLLVHQDVTSAVTPLDGTPGFPAPDTTAP
jgi:erythromycin esterase-like protein